MSKKLKLFSLIGVFLLAISNGKADVVVIAPDTGWHHFLFPGMENLTSPYDYSWFTSFKFTLTQPALLTVQDLGDSYEQFEVYDNGRFIFMTSDPSGDSVGYVHDPDLAANIPELSRGQFLLMPGDHVITGVNLFHVSTDYGGEAALRLDTVRDTVSINEPNIMSLLILSLLIWAAVSFYPSKRRPTH